MSKAELRRLTAQYEEESKKEKAVIARMEMEDKMAKAEGRLVGRYLKEGIADGYAFYRITKVSQRTATLVHIKGIGDNYRVPMLGDGGTAKLSYVQQNVEWRDALSEIFSKKS
jgi:hypothetical protein